MVVTRSLGILTRGIVVDGLGGNLGCRFTITDWSELFIRHVLVFWHGFVGCLTGRSGMCLFGILSCRWAFLNSLCAPFFHPQLKPSCIDHHNESWPKVRRVMVTWKNGGRLASTIGATKDLLAILRL